MRKAPSSGFRKADSALRIVQIIGDAASSVVIFLIAAELFPAGVAIIPAMLCSFSPHLAYNSLMLAPDSLSILPLLLAVYLLIRAIKRPRFIAVVTAGALVGLSCWLRSNALLLAPFLVLIIPLLFERGKRLRYSLALISGTVITIAPVIIRNWIVFHQFIPLSTMAGLNLVEGIGDYDKENRFGMPSSDAESALKDAEWHDRPDYADNLWRPNGIERDNERFRRGLSVARSNPGWFLGVMLRRMEFMLRYNDFRQQDFPHLATAPTVSDGPALATSWRPLPK
ncbi:MAG: glycosyltransferase family 39 protein [Acidobacteriota bacterium]